MPWRGSRFDGELPSLGYTLLEWYADLLRVPAGEMLGQPLVFTDEQARFIIRYYTFDPETGRFLYRRAVSMRVKGWGKSPMLAAVSLGEMCAPVLFDGWDANGEPVGRPWPSPLIQIAAVSEDQTDNTYEALREMVAYGTTVDDLGLDPAMMTRIVFQDGPGKIEPVTASAGSREGQPVTFGVLDETHLWVPTNGGTRLARTLRRNVGKNNGRSIESTNAFVPGEESVAEASWAARRSPGVLFDAGPRVPRVADLADRDEMLPALKIAYGDSHWVDLERMFEEANDPDTGEHEARRFFLNEVRRGTRQFVDRDTWAALASRTRHGQPPAGTEICAGFDGSKFHDATGIVGVTEDGYVFQIAVWEKPLDPARARGWEVPVDQVNNTVDEMFKRYRVVRFYCDPPYWTDEVIAWNRKYGDVVAEFHTNKDIPMARAVGQLETAIRSRAITHCGSAALARHMANAHKRKVRVKWDDEREEAFVLEKERKGSPRKMDLAVCTTLGRSAATDATAAGEWGRRRKSRKLVTF